MRHAVRANSLRVDAGISRLAIAPALAGAERGTAVLRRDPRVRLVYLFGSSAAPHTSEVRDVDMAVLTDPPLTLDELLRLRADVIAEARVPIDLVALNDAPVVLAREVADGGRCLYARSPDDETAFVTHARARYWDFKPYLDEHKLTFPAALDPKMDLANAYGVRALPSSFVVDRKGEITALALGPRAWDDDAAHSLIEGLLK